MNFVESTIQEKRTLRQNYLRQKATEAGYESVDDYIKSLQIQQAELQPLAIPEKSKSEGNPWNWVANHYKPTSEWGK